MLNPPSAVKWILGALLALTVMLLQIVLAFASVTATGASERTLAHSIAVLTEVDAFLDEHYPSIEAEAAETNEASITVRDFPVTVSFTATEVQELDREQFRSLLLSRAAGIIHDQGMSAFRDNTPDEVDSLSTQGAVRTGLDLFRPTPHQVFVWLTVAFSIAAALLAAALALSTHRWMRVAAISASVLVAALPFLVFAIAVRFALRVAADGSDDYVAREFLHLTQELGWAAIRNGMIFAVGSGAILILAFILDRQEQRDQVSSHV